MNEKHYLQCPVCMAEYHDLHHPEEFKRVQQSRLARLSAEVLAKDKLPAMSKEEQDELVANLGLDKWYASKADLLPQEQAAIAGYLKATFPEAKAFGGPPLLEQVCLGLQELGVDCIFQTQGEPCLIVPLVTGGKQWAFGIGDSKYWEGLLTRTDGSTDRWLSNISVGCRDVLIIIDALFAWIKRFDYREYRGPSK